MGTGLDQEPLNKESPESDLNALRHSDVHLRCKHRIHPSISVASSNEQVVYMQSEPSAQPDWDRQAPPSDLTLLTDADHASAGPSGEWSLADFEIGRPLGKGQS